MDSYGSRFALVACAGVLALVEPWSDWGLEIPAGAVGRLAADAVAPRAALATEPPSAFRRADTPFGPPAALLDLVERAPGAAPSAAGAGPPAVRTPGLPLALGPAPGADAAAPPGDRAPRTSPPLPPPPPEVQAPTPAAPPPPATGTAAAGPDGLPSAGPSAAAPPPPRTPDAAGLPAPVARSAPPVRDAGDPAAAAAVPPAVPAPVAGAARAGVDGTVAPTPAAAAADAPAAPQAHPRDAARPGGAAAPPPRPAQARIAAVRPTPETAVRRPRLEELATVRFGEVSAALDFAALGLVSAALRRLQPGDRLEAIAARPSDPLTRHRVEAIRRRLAQLGYTGELQVHRASQTLGPDEVVLAAGR